MYVYVNLPAIGDTCIYRNKGRSVINILSVHVKGVIIG